MYGFLIACILSAVSLFLPAYSIDFGSTGFTSASSDVYRIISSYYSWPVLVCAIGGIVVILAMYRRKLVLISGILQTVGLGYQLFNITRIQDEAHRFAIEYHRSLRSKAQVKSSLDDIPGIGPARRKALMRHFKSIEDIRNAEIERLMEIPEIPERTAKQIYDFFHGEQSAEE